MNLYSWLRSVKHYTHEEAMDACTRYQYGYYFSPPKFRGHVIDYVRRDVEQWVKEEKDKPRQW